jgi:hypothetical protein
MTHPQRFCSCNALSGKMCSNIIQRMGGMFGSFVAIHSCCSLLNATWGLTHNETNGTGLVLLSSVVLGTPSECLQGASTKRLLEFWQLLEVGKLASLHNTCDLRVLQSLFSSLICWRTFQWNAASRCRHFLGLPKASSESAGEPASSDDSSCALVSKEFSNQPGTPHQIDQGLLAKCPMCEVRGTDINC